MTVSGLIEEWARAGLSLWLVPEGDGETIDAD
jgi:hypothetical protein